MTIILQFKNLTLEDKYIFDEYLKKHNILSYEYTFASLYLWRKLCSTKYAIIDDTLIIIKNEEFKGSFFMQPLGYKKENLESLIKKLMDIRKEYPTKYLFGDVNEDFINDIRNYTSFDICSIKDDNDAEYIYSTEELIALSGKKFHGKKNHYNSFIKNYPDYKIIEINCENKEDCMSLLKQWHSVKEEVDKELIMETDAIDDVICKIDTLNMKGIGVCVNNNLIAFTLGEIYANGTMANILVEKADTRYNGVYAFINCEFLKYFFKSTTYVNRQEDCGNNGLRKSKLSYNPIRMEEKYLLNLN